MQDSGATDLSALLGSGPVQNPSLPQSTTFAPMVTGGVDPFIAPVNTSNQNKPAVTNYNHDATFNSIRYAIRGLMMYFGFFLAAAVISLSTPRSLLLQYIPHTYTTGGTVSYTGAAVLGLAAVAIAYVVGTLGSSLI